MFRSCIFTLLFLAGAVAFAEEAPLTVESAVSEALAKNPSLRALEARIETTRRNVGVAKVYPFNPEFNFEEGFDRHFGISQTFEWPGKRTLREAIAKQDVAVARATLEGFKVALATEVRVSFYEVLAAQKLIEVQETQQKAAETVLDFVVKRVEGGFAPVTERTKAHADVVKAKRGVRAAQKAVVIARASLNLLLGRDADVATQLQGELAAPQAEIALPKLVEAALTRSPELRIQRAELEKRGLVVKLARKEIVPDITIEPFFEYDAEDPNTNKVGVGLTVPLPIWRTSRPFVAVAQAEQSEAVAVFEKTQREVIASVQKAFAAFTATREELALFPPDLLKELETQLAITQQKYADGQVSFLLLLEIQQTYFDYLSDYYESLANVRAAQSELEKAATTSLEELK